MAQRFSKQVGPVMMCAAAEEDGDNLIDGRGDAFCGALSAMLNAILRKVKLHLSRKVVGLPKELAVDIAHFENVARVVLGLRGLKVITFGPRPHDFFACNAPIEELLGMGVEVMENSELDLRQGFAKIKKNDPEVVATVEEMARELGLGNTYPDLLPKLARLVVFLKRFAEANKGFSNFVVFANKCWPGFEKAFGFVPCFVNAWLAAMGIPVACEVDIYGAVSEYICQCAAGEALATLLDINNTVPRNLLKGVSKRKLRGVKPEELFMGFHCGNTMKKCLLATCKMCFQLIMRRLMEKGKTPNITRGTLEGTLKPGPITMFRLQPKAGGGLQAYIANGDVLDIDPKSFGGIGIIGIPDFMRFYRYVMMEKGFPHHGAFVFKQVGSVIFDAMQLWGVTDISTPLKAGVLYPTENPFN